MPSPTSCCPMWLSLRFPRRLSQLANMRGRIRRLDSGRLSMPGSIHRCLLGLPSALMVTSTPARRLVSLEAANHRAGSCHRSHRLRREASTKHSEKRGPDLLKRPGIRLKTPPLARVTTATWHDPPALQVTCHHNGHLALPPRLRSRFR
jgi:hypothetical protein